MQTNNAKESEVRKKKKQLDTTTPERTEVLSASSSKLLPAIAGIMAIKCANERAQTHEKGADPASVWARPHNMKKMQRIKLMSCKQITEQKRHFRKVSVGESFWLGLGSPSGLRLSSRWPYRRPACACASLGSCGTARRATEDPAKQSSI